MLAHSARRALLVNRLYSSNQRVLNNDDDNIRKIPVRKTTKRCGKHTKYLYDPSGLLQTYKAVAKRKNVNFLIERVVKILFRGAILWEKESGCVCV